MTKNQLTIELYRQSVTYRQGYKNVSKTRLYIAIHTVHSIIAVYTV